VLELSHRGWIHAAANQPSAHYRVAMTREAGRNATPVLMGRCCALELDPDLLDWLRDGLEKWSFKQQEMRMLRGPNNIKWVARCDG
jgi:hypothetical protein